MASLSGGPTTASSLSAPQQRLMNAFTNKILGIQTMPDGSIRRAGPNLLQQGATPYKGQLSLDPNFYSPQSTADYLTGSVLTPALRNFDQYIRPRIAESFAGGAFSSRYGTAVQQSLGDINSQFMAQLNQAQLGNQQFQAQAMQNQLSGRYQEFLRTSPENNPFLQLALGGTGQSQLYAYNKPGFFQQFLGGTALGASMFSGGDQSAVSGIGRTLGAVLGA
jgi:hypothetical protein